MCKATVSCWTKVGTGGHSTFDLLRVITACFPTHFYFALHLQTNEMCRRIVKSLYAIPLSAFDILMHVADVPVYETEYKDFNARGPCLVQQSRPCSSELIPFGFGAVRVAL